jgi:glucose-1-phosphate adenylyltransferase
MRSVLSMILGGGQGKRLYPLTKLRSKPAVPVAGKYRLIDIPISNCINSGMNRIYVVTQFMSVSLHRHIANTYKFDMFGQGFVEILAAQQTLDSANWYQGTADAVRQNRRQIIEDSASDALILAGDQLYRMDFRTMMKTHIESDADVTLAVIPRTAEEVTGLGILRCNEEGRIIDFFEKPKTKAERDPYFIPTEWIEKRGIPCKGRNFLANMGIYIFKKQALLEMLDSPFHDFGSQIFPNGTKKFKMHVHLFDGYWEDLGTIESYHSSALALASDHPPFDFHSPDGIIFTRMRFLPASRIEDAVLKQSLISDGCVVLPGTRIEESLLGVRSRVGRNCILKKVVMIGADRFETDAERIENRRKGVPDLNVGDGSVIERAILDKDCRIGKNVRILNEKKIMEADEGFYAIRDGIVVIPRGSIIPDNFVI